MMHCFYCGRDTVPVRDCNSRKTQKSLRMRLILPANLGGSGRKDNLKPACRMCDQLLDTLGNCVAALRIYIHLGEQMKYGKGSPAAIGYVRKLAA